MPTIELVGPYPHRNRVRFRLKASDGRKSWAPTGATEQEARVYAEKARDAFRARIELTVDALIERKLAAMRANERTEGGINATAEHLRRVLLPVLGMDAGGITPARAAALYHTLTADYAAATHQEGLRLVRALWAGAVADGIVRVNPWVAVKPVGRRRRGKVQLTIDEAKRFVDTCLADAMVSDAALACLLQLLIGARSSEILRRAVRDVDQGGTVLLIPFAKSRAGVRAPDIPDFVQSAVMARTIGRAPTDPLLRDTKGRVPTNSWLQRKVRLYCRKAGVPEVCPHGLRGGWASYAYGSGALSHHVAAAMGHASPSMTKAHYATPQSVLAGEQARRTELLRPSPQVVPVQSPADEPADDSSR